MKNNTFAGSPKAGLGSGKDTGTNSFPAAVALPLAVSREVVLSAHQNHSSWAAHIYACCSPLLSALLILLQLPDPCDHLHFRACQA